MTARIEFTRAVRRERLRIAALICEASGPRYGWPADFHCNMSLSFGVEFDHYIPFEFTRDSSLDNCRAICRRCHKFATANDIRAIRKSDRVRDKHTSAFKPSVQPLPGSKRSGWRHKMDGTWERREARK